MATTRRSFGAKVARPARRFCDGPRFTARAGFTLTELLVAVAIMAGMMTMVAMIFTTATRSSGQAQAMASLHRQVRQVAEGIRRDLASIDPGAGGEAIMGIVRVDVPAYLTQQDRDTGRTLVTDPTQSTNDVYRADVLMVVTPRTFKPYVYTPPDNRPSEYDCAFADRRLVVYGHADLGTLQTDGTWVTGATRTIEGDPSPIPASQWHLARRIIGFAIDPAEVRGSDNKAGWPQFSLVDNRFTGRIGNTDQFADVYLSQADLFPTPSGHFRYNADNQVTMYYVENDDGTYRYELSRDRYYLLARDPNGGDYMYWWDSPDGADPWSRREEGMGSLDLPPPFPPPAPSVSDFENSNPWNWTRWFYISPDSRSLLDPDPPVGQERRLAHYYLPGCSEFRVEFTYDDAREIDIALDADAGYHRPRLIDWDGDSAESLDVPAPAPVRWQSVPNRERWIWSNLSTDPNPYGIGGSGDLRDRTHPYRWPRAIRITLRVHDPAGRLPEPVTQTIVHAWR